MIPYADFLYFGILLYITLPTLLIRRLLGFSRAWVLLATAAMLVVQYGTVVHFLPMTAPEGVGSAVSGRLAEVRQIWVVLACGLAATVFSDLPSLRLFGWLSAFAMISALVADMLILRPAIMFLRRLAG